VLQLHCSEFGYNVRKETPVAEQPPSPREESLEDVLVCFICYEKSDEGRTDEITKQFVENIKVDVSRIGCSSVLLYPYAHLSKSLGSPRRAKGFLNNLRQQLQKAESRSTSPHSAGTRPSAYTARATRWRRCTGSTRARPYQG
jgi:threonyl-tRNA synthetase